MTILSALRDLLEPFHAMNYTDYLRTDAWRRRRDRAIKRAGGRCQVCGRTSGLQVHHNTYDNLGREKAIDLVVLCGTCHKLYHDAKRLARR